MQNKQHKNCVQGVINTIKKTHQSFKEYPIFRNSDVHFIDVVAFPHQDRPYLRPLGVECECGSAKKQRISNARDLLEFKKRYPDAEIFQVDNAGQINWKRLIRQRV